MPALPADRPGCPKMPGKRGPLPDLAGVRLYLVPDSAPPYDEEVCAREPGCGGLPAWVPHGEMPGSEMPGSEMPGSEMPGSEVPGGDGDRGGRRPPADATGAPPGWPDRFAQALAEALAGARPPRQLVPWTTEEALERIQRLGPRLSSAQRPLVRRVITSWPAADVLEMTVVVGFGPRVKALAVRLERTRPRPAAQHGQRTGERWVCTAVEAA